MDLLSAIGSRTNFIEPAYITVHDARAAAEAAGANGADAVNKAKQALEEPQTTPKPKYKENDKRFRIQFNPNELMLRAYSDEVSISNYNLRTQNAEKEQENTPPNAGYIELEVNLVFDKLIVANAFSAEKGGSPLDITKGVAAVYNNVKGKKDTVAKEVEGFIAAVRNPYTRYVTFSWKDFVFCGTVYNMNSEYSMFDIDGDPVRANIRLNIRMYGGEFAMDNWVKKVPEDLGTTSLQAFSNLWGSVM